ncbi:MAG: PIG-L family deacetylase [Bacteroidetes bacterium]|nr:PIG-L family deacetylase [Bacteroidota bacterium]
MNKKIVIIAPHADDETLGCGGTILKQIANGDKVYWILVTSGKDKVIFINADIEHYNNNIDKVALAYGFTRTIKLNLPVVRLDTIPEYTIYDRLADTLKDIEPEIVYIPYINDVHADHQIISRVMISCTKNFRFPFIDKVYMYETASETDFTPAIQSLAFVPNRFVDITDYMDDKLEIMRIYSTELMPDPLPRSFHAIKGLAAVRGSRIGVKYAEAFVSLFEKA